MTSFCEGITCPWYQFITYEGNDEQQKIKAICTVGGIYHVILDEIDRGPIETNVPLMLIQQPCLAPPEYQNW